VGNKGNYRILQDLRSSR